MSYTAMQSTTHKRQTKTRHSRQTTDDRPETTEDRRHHKKCFLRVGNGTRMDVMNTYFNLVKKKIDIYNYLSEFVQVKIIRMNKATAENKYKPLRKIRIHHHNRTHTALFC